MTQPNPTEDEVAAALAAVSCYVAESEPLVAQPTEAWQWSAAATLAVQGVVATRMPLRPGWNTVERLRRAGRGMKGIIGL